MAGIATQLQIFDLTLKGLQTSADPELNGIAKVMTDNPVYANLGAIGPNLADFIPSDPPPDLKDPINSDPNPYALVWKMVFGIIGGDPGFFSVLQRIRFILNKLQTIAGAEDCDALKAIQDGKDPDFKLEDIQTEADKLAALVAALNPLPPNNSNTIPTLAGIITDKLKPKVCTDNPATPVPPPDQWQPREFLQWKRPDQFIAALLDKGRKAAADTGDERLLAYAYGYIISYSANVCSNSFINSSVGGPMRTQWWRQRFVRNYVDAWVFGFYNQSPRPTMTGDTPSVPYDAWPNLCSANFQKRIELTTMDPAGLMQSVKTAKPFPKVLPDDFAQLWFEAFQSAYPAPRPPNVTANSLNGAYLMVWLVLWFQTSGAVLDCKPVEPMVPPGGCGDSPSAPDPFAKGPDGGPTPPPGMDTDLKDTTAEVCGIILAILGIALVLTGYGAAVGAGFLIGAIELLDCSSVVKWQKLRCELYSYSMYLHNGMKGLHTLLALAALDYPYAQDMAVDPKIPELLSLIPFVSGIQIVKSRVQREDFPSKPWTGSLVTFNQRPTSTNPGFETPRTIACTDEVYPQFFVDDDTNNPLSHGDVKTGGPFPFRPRTPGSGLPIQFGNAVANALDLFKNLKSQVPNWNLDQDRGLAFLTWQFKGGYDPDNVQIEPEV